MMDETPRAVEPEEAPAIRILIVDDEPDFRAYAGRLCRKMGLEVVLAGDGAEALELLQEGGFDMLLADYGMPKLNGLELITHVRAAETMNGIYAVMLTGRDALALKIHALSLGYDDFLPKGCTEVEVVAKVAAAKRMLGRQRALDASAREWRMLASNDALTGVASRRFFFDEASRAVAGAQQFAVVLFDLDDFKAINDRYGHLTGDRILRDIGELFIRSTRGEDVIARFGGDEFVLMISNLTPEATHRVAGRLAQDIASLRWSVGESEISITASMGLAFSTLVTDPTLENILGTADRDLYAHKWLRKHPDATAAELYEYTKANEGARVVSMPERVDVRSAAKPAEAD